MLAAQLAIRVSHEVYMGLLVGMLLCSACALVTGIVVATAVRIATGRFIVPLLFAGLPGALVGGALAAFTRFPGLNLHLFGLNDNGTNVIVGASTGAALYLIFLLVTQVSPRKSI